MESILRKISARLQNATLGVAVLAAVLITSTTIVNPQVARSDSGTQTSCRTDSSYSFTACITQYYSVTGPSDSIVNVTAYTVRITRIDPSQLVQVSSILIREGRGGSVGIYYCNGYYSTPTVVERTVSGPSMGVTYTLVPPWHAAWTRVAGGFEYQCGNVTFWVKRYASTWEARVPNVCWGDPSAGSIGYP